MQSRTLSYHLAKHPNWADYIFPWQCWEATDTKLLRGYHRLRKSAVFHKLHIVLTPPHPSPNLFSHCTLNLPIFCGGRMKHVKSERPPPQPIIKYIAKSRLSFSDSFHRRIAFCFFQLLGELGELEQWEARWNVQNKRAHTPLNLFPKFCQNDQLTQMDAKW